MQIFGLAVLASVVGLLSDTGYLVDFPQTFPVSLQVV